MCQYCSRPIFEKEDKYFLGPTGELFCSADCMRHWNENQQKTQKFNDTASKIGSGIAGVMGSTIASAFASEKEDPAVAAMKEAAYQERKAAEEARDAEIGAELSKMEIPEGEEALEDFIEDLIARFKALSSDKGDNEAEKKAIKVLMEKALRRYSKVADKKDYKKLSKKWKRTKLLKNQLAVILLCIGALLVLGLILSAAGV